jgi:hypothetical protein
MFGGGLYRCNGLIKRNAIASNIGESAGGGLLDCDGTIIWNTIEGN